MANNLPQGSHKTPKVLTAALKIFRNKWKYCLGSYTTLGDSPELGLFSLGIFLIIGLCIIVFAGILTLMIAFNSSSSIINGKPIVVISVQQGGHIKYHEDDFRNIIAKCGSRKIAIIAVAGDFRKGKSFLLNLFLRFLHHTTQNTNWLSDLTGTVNGFETRGGSVKVTQGISFWSEPFFIKNADDEEVAVVLCDSQGLFDNETPSKINSFIFGFSAVMPSLLIFNLKDNVDEKSLDNLASFAPKMGKLGLFQHVKFLIRDWNDDDRHSQGSLGGNTYLSEVLHESNDQQLNKTRSTIKKWLPSVSGFLLPPPGIHVERSKSNSKIYISKVDQQFIKFVDQLCHQIFHENIEIKKREGKNMKAEDILAFASYLVKQFEDGKIDDPGTHWETDSKQICQAAKDEWAWAYRQWIPEKLLIETERLKEPYVSDSFLAEIHQLSENEAIERYSKAAQIYPHHDEFKKKLEREISHEYEVRMNDNYEIRFRRIAEVAFEKAKERERLLTIKLEENEAEKIRLEEEHQIQIMEAEERRSLDMRELEEKLRNEIKVAKKHRGLLRNLLQPLLAVADAIDDALSVYFFGP